MTYNIIKTENYLLVVDDSEIKVGDWCLANGVTYNNTVVKYLKIPCPPPYVSNLSILKKIIAHLPLNSPTLYGVHLLPPLEGEVEKLGIHDLESYYGSNLELTASGRMWEDGFDIGYNKAKEKYKYTEEDLRKMFSRAWELRERYNGSDRNGYEENYPSNWKDMDYEERQDWFYEQGLKSLTKYPTAFECEMEWYNPKTNQSAYSLPEITGLNDNDGCYMKTKTTSNSQGQTILAGKYILKMKP